MEFALLGITYDKTQTYRKGAAKAPDFLRTIFPKLETFRNGVDLSDHTIHDLDNISPESAPDIIVQTTGRLSIAGKKHFPIILGGEHTVSLGGIHGLRPKTVVILDAHADCEKGDGHDGVVRKIAEAVGAKNIILYGVRAFSKTEAEWLKTNKVRIAKTPAELRRAAGPVYLSIDFDVLDPSVMPAVGNPEPSGLSCEEVLAAVRALAKKLVAVDFVEYTPLGTTMDEIAGAVAGNLIYSTMAEIIRSKK
jgi:agmatinase